MTSGIKIISLDLDGVLFDGPSAVFVIAQQIGLKDQYLELIQRAAQEEMTLRDTVTEVAKIWKGIPIDATYHYLVKRLPLMEGAEETVATLQEWGYDVGCISSGVSQFFMEPFTRRLNLDFAYSHILGSENEVHDGTVQFIMGGPEKATTIWQYAQIKEHPLDSIASVGNGFNDIDLFKISSFSVAFNPVDKKVSDAASVTIESKDLRSILPHFERL
ncbi:MAG: HAD-IB family phosphatase [Candidatus Thorarchaeota archaeon]|jgi:phosphoserine phosphatase